MADQFDRASDLEELERISAINLHQKSIKESVKATGFCLYCEEPLSDGMRWCDAECRDEWERLQAKAA